MIPKSKVWYLENFNFFSELDVIIRSFIDHNTTMKTLKKGKIVYFQDDPAKSVYFLKEGKINITKFTSLGKEFLIAILDKGEIFGVSSITSPNKRKEAAIAEEDVVYCVMKEEKFKELLHMSPTLNYKFCQFLEKKLEIAQKRLEDLSCKTNQQRIIEFLKETALLSSKGQNGELVINNSLTHQRIAQLTSTNRQEVSRLFSHLKKNKIIEYDRKMIKILDIDRLAIVDPPF